MVFLHIVRYEWKLLISQKIFLLTVLFTALLLFTALYIGFLEVENQKNTLAEIETFEKAHYQKLGLTLDEIAQNGFQGNAHADPSRPSTMALRNGFRFAAKEPALLQPLHIGQSDLFPYYFKVTANKLQALYHEAEIVNPTLQFIGAFDFSFVVTYLIPLLLIAFCFDLVSREKESGTLPFLQTANVPFFVLTASKAMVRCMLIFGLTWLSAGMVLLLAGQGVSFFLSANWWWFSLILLGYLFIWTSLALLVNSFQRGSHFNASVLVMCWLLWAVVVPGALQYLTNWLYPMPSRVTLITETREAGIEAQQKASKLLEDYIQDHPELVEEGKPLNLQDFATKYFIQLQETEQAIAPSLAAFELQRANQEQFVDKFFFISPPLLFQEMMNEVSGTAEHHYLAFRKDASLLQQGLRELLIKRILIGTPMTSTDLAAIPSFVPGSRYQEPNVSLMTYGALWLFALSALFLFAARYSLKKIEANSSKVFQ
jgi:ABC-2 type transport system permease protein